MRYNAFVNIRLIILALLGLIISAGCSAGSDKKNLVVSWAGGYQMHELLSEASEIKTIEDIKSLLVAPWYAEVEVAETKSAPVSKLKNCAEYLAEATEKTHAKKDNEINAFLELAVMCRATEILVSAEASKLSYVPGDFINESLSAKLPAAMALQTSTTEANKTRSDSAKQFWGDVNVGLKFEATAKDRGRYYGGGGSQVITVVGRGDFNRDGYEDVLMTSRDSVEGGSYFNYRLFALTVLNDGKWRLVKEYKY